LLYQIYYIGVKSQSVVLITGAFTGMVLAAADLYPVSQGQNGHRHARGREHLNVQRTRPVLTALMVAGCVGAAMAAEIGTMRVTEQIDALRAPGHASGGLSGRAPADSGAPRTAAAHGGSHRHRILGGYFVSVNLLDIEPTYLWRTC